MLSERTQVSQQKRRKLPAPVHSCPRCRIEPVKLVWDRDRYLCRSCGVPLEFARKGGLREVPR